MHTKQKLNLQTGQVTSLVNYYFILLFRKIAPHFSLTHWIFSPSSSLQSKDWILKDCKLEQSEGYTLFNKLSNIFVSSKDDLQIGQVESERHSKHKRC